MLGIAISTAIPAVGGLCCFGASDAGMVATQSWINPYLGIDSLPLLREGRDPQSVLADVLSRDPRCELRQVGVVATSGASAAFTGSECTGWAGHRSGPGYAVQGNMLVDESTVAGLEQTFVATDGQPLPERLILALESGQNAGGDMRGRQSAALRIYSDEEYPFVDLRVDDDREPVTELRRIWGLSKAQLLPYVELLPKRDVPAGRYDAQIIEGLMLAPSERPTDLGEGEEHGSR